MPTPQEWLNNKYADKQTKIINLSNLKSIAEEGELKIADFPNLEKIESNKPIYKINKIVIADCPKLAIVHLRSFTNDKELAITNCPNLKTLDCSDGQQLFNIINEKDNRYEELQRQTIYRFITSEMLLDITKQFAQARLDKRTVELRFNKSGEGEFINGKENIAGFVRWKDSNQNFEIHLRTNMDREKIFYILAHELAHAVIMLRENGNPSLLNSRQEHSHAFWETFLEGDNSTLAFVRDKLDRIDQLRLKDYLKVNPELISVNNAPARWVYFPDPGRNLKDKIRRKKYFQSAEEADKEWKRIRIEVLQKVNDSMNGLWSDPDERNKRWIQVEVQSVKPSEASKEGKGQYKIYAYHNNGDKEFKFEYKDQSYVIPAAGSLALPIGLKNELDKILTPGQQWMKEGINETRANNLSEKKLDAEQKLENQFEAPPLKQE